MSNIFKHSGHVNVELDPAMVPPERRSQYIAMRDAQIACEQAESNEKTANDAVAEAAKVHDRALAALPRGSFMDEWRASRVNELPPETAAKGSDAAGVGTVSAPVPMPRVAPDDALRNAAHDLDVARWEARQCRAATLAARENFNIALRGWNATMPVQTQLQAKMDYIRTNQEERARKAAQGSLRRPMTVTETAKAMSGGNRRAGGGAAYKRNGTFTRAEAAKIEMNRAAANRVAAAAARMAGSNAPRTKLPSER